MELLTKKLNLTDDIAITVKINLSSSPDKFLVLAHGKFNNIDHPLLEFLAKEMSVNSTTVIRFNFPYVENNDPLAKTSEMLERSYLAVIDKSIIEYCQNRQIPYFIGGKSLGAYISAKIFRSLRIKPQGMVFLGYPLHTPSDMANLRDNNLYTIDVPTLFVQGTKDPYCSIETLHNILPRLREPTLELIEGGGHSYEGTSLSEVNINQAIFERVNSWILNRFSRIVL